MKREREHIMFRLNEFAKLSLTLLLLCTMVSEPIISSYFLDTGFELEICNNFDELDSEEKEETTESEDNTEKICNAFYDVDISTKKSLASLSSYIYILAPHLDIPFPPPDLA